MEGRELTHGHISRLATAHAVLVGLILALAFWTGSFLLHSWRDSRAPATGAYTVAASNSRGRAAADFLCDGSNDEATVKLAMDAAGRNGGGQVVLLAGDYMFGSPLRLDETHSSITLEGQGEASVIHPADSIGDWCIRVEGSGAWWPPRAAIGIEIRRLKITGSLEHTFGIWIGNAGRCTLDSIVIVKARVGISVGEGSHQVQIRNCVLNDILVEGIHLEDAHDCRVVSNQMEFNWMERSSVADGDSWGVRAVRCYQVFVEGNSVENVTSSGAGSYGQGVTFVSTVDGRISGNSIEECDIGIVISSVNASESPQEVAVSVVANNLRRNRVVQMYVERSTHVLVADNVLLNALSSDSGAGIRVSASSSDVRLFDNLINLVNPDLEEYLVEDSGTVLREDAKIRQ